jgi:hypothetical protein
MPYKWVSLSTGAPFGNLNVFAFQGVLRENEIISSLFCWTKKKLRLQVWGTYGTLLKGQGSPELISDCGAQRASLQGLGASGHAGSTLMLVFLFMYPSSPMDNILKLKL